MTSAWRGVLSEPVICGTGRIVIGPNSDLRTAWNSYFTRFSQNEATTVPRHATVNSTGVSVRLTLDD